MHVCAHCSYRRRRSPRSCSQRACEGGMPHACPCGSLERVAATAITAARVAATAIIAARVTATAIVVARVTATAIVVAVSAFEQQHRPQRRRFPHSRSRLAREEGCRMHGCACRSCCRHCHHRRPCRRHRHLPPLPLPPSAAQPSERSASASTAISSLSSIYQQRHRLQCRCSQWMCGGADCGCVWAPRHRSCRHQQCRQMSAQHQLQGL